MQKKEFAAKSVATVLALSLSMASLPVEAGAAVKKPVLNKTVLSLEKGETAKLNVKKKGNKIKKIIWKSTDKKVAKVSRKGLVTAVAEGSAVVKAVCKIKGKKKKTTLKCDVTVFDSSTPAVGAWDIATDPTITPEIAGYITKATEFLSGASYEPYALLATQVVAGMNYRVFCKTTPVVLNPVAYYTIVEFYVDLQGKVSNFKVKASTQGAFDALPTADGLAASGSAVSGTAVSGTAVVGGFVQAKSPVIDAKYLPLLENFKFPNGMPGPFRAVAILGTQVVANGMNVILISERDVDVETGQSLVGYYLTTAYVSSDLKPSFTVAMPITPDISNYDVATDIPEAVVEKFANEVKAAVLQNNWEKLSTMINYPIEVKTGVKIKDAAEFKEFMSKNKMSESFKKAIIEEDCMNMFARDQGIMIGAAGEIWIGEVNGSLKIIAFNGFVD